MSPPRRTAPVPVLRLLKLGHLLGLALFLGATLGITLLVLAGAALADGTHFEFALQAAQRLRHGLLAPGMIVMLATGIMLSASGPWGFVKFRWMVAKLALTLLLVLHNHRGFGPTLDQLLALAQHGGAMPPAPADVLSFLVRAAAIQAGLVILLAALSIFKPGGRMPVAPRAMGPTIPVEAPGLEARSR